MDDVRAQLAPYLLPGEILLWTGRPDPGKHFGRSDLFLVPFSIFWVGFMLFWVVGVARSSAPAFSLFGLPFLAIGLYITVGRFYVKARRNRRIGYGLTRGRALVAVGAASLSESPLQRIPIGVHRARDGQHLTVIFGRSASGWSNGSMYANTGMDFFNRGTGPLGFYDVPDVAGLERALRETLADAGWPRRAAPAIDTSALNVANTPALGVPGASRSDAAPICRRRRVSVPSRVPKSVF